MRERDLISGKNTFCRSYRQKPAEVFHEVHQGQSVDHPALNNNICHRIPMLQDFSVYLQPGGEKKIQL